MCELVTGLVAVAFAVAFVWERHRLRIYVARWRS